MSGKTGDVVTNLVGNAGTNSGSVGGPEAAGPYSSARRFETGRS
jgi:hypothetical protein